MDEATWLPVADVTGVESATVKSDGNRDGSAPLMQSADLTVTGAIDEGYYRLSEIDGASSTTIATLLLIADSADWSYGSWSASVTGKSVLAHASEVYFEPGAYVPMNTDCIAWAARILSDDLPCPVSYEGSFRLAEHVVFDLGASHLDGVWDVLDVAGYTMTIAGDGTVSIHQRPSEPALTVSTENRGVLGCEISRGIPIVDIPNVLRVYVDGKQYTASNDDPASPTSTVARGRRIEAIEEDPTMKEGEAVMSYAMRRLFELGEVWETYDVTRSYASGVSVNAIVRANLPEQGIDGDFIVMSQSIECSGDIFISETWGRLA